MKNILYCKQLKLLLALAMLNTFSVVLLAQESIKDSISRSFIIDADANIELENQFGDILIETWDKNELQIDIRIKVKSKKSEETKKTRERIDIDFSHSEDYLVIQTEFDKGGNWMKSLLNDIKLINRPSIDVEYKVLMPNTCKLSISNRYGDVVIPDWENDIKLHLIHGSLQTGNINGFLKGKLEFVDARMKKIEDAEINSKHSDGRLKSAKEFDLESNGSSWEADFIKHLDINSTRDDIEVEELGVLKGNTRFCEIDIENLTDRMILDCSLGELEVQNIGPDVEVIRLQEKATDVYFNLANHPFKLNATMESGTFLVPKGSGNLKVNTIDEKSKKREITGIFGSNPSPPLNVQITGNNGTIQLDWEE